MKKITFAIFITFGLTNPFKELDKSFLYEEDTLVKESSQSNSLKEDCMNRMLYSNQIGMQYFQKNPKDLHDFCNCLTNAKKIYTKEDLIKIEKSLQEFWTNNKKIDNGIFEFVETWASCAADLLKEWNDKGLLNDMRSEFMAIFDEIITQSNQSEEEDLTIDMGQKIEQEKKVQENSTNTILDNKKESKSEKKPKTKIDKESFEEKIKDYTKIDSLSIFVLGFFSDLDSFL